MGIIKKILIIDDDRMSLELEKTLFETAGYSILESMDAEKGIAMAKETKPDVIIIDFQLPKINGCQAIDMLKDDPATCNIPCILVTASATAREIERLKSSKANGYIPKPINTRTFVKQVIELAKENAVH